MEKMLKRFNRYIFNSLKVANVCMGFFILQHIPWAKMPTAPLGGKIIVGVITWAVWSFMVMIVDLQDDKERGNLQHHSKPVE